MSHQFHPNKPGRAPSRRRFLLGSAAALAGAPALNAVTGGFAHASTGAIAEEGDPGPATPREALRLLEEGNERWVRGRLVHPHQTVARRIAVAPEQHPFATVFSCIDSRVPPEIVFDRGVGDLFVIRTAAQTLDGLVQGAVEYGEEEATTPLVVVMGHQRCGAVTLAVQVLNTGEPVPDHLVDVVRALTPAYEAAKPLPGDQIDNTIRAQIRLTVRQLRGDPIVDAVHSNVIGAYYSLDTGCVDFTVVP
ncbi:carbonic anhydrase [Amycolatopsis taiwanensis]|uniref:Carbonic anhydrase n=1 Tax=Amycolatopsis taiwanensis TaxID=342230 RepID=A0A9W6QW24_9PSEU|nr:carbonic anhydrase [Amycolatopsis taiwanensis]GLY63990.1 carbonic anhydrase [Amycolatopsis taiwanensis]